MTENLTDQENSTEDSASDEKILELAKTRFNLAEEADKQNRLKGREDLLFYSGEQWPSDIKRLREKEKRPCLTINKMPQYVRQITNDQRQNRSSIKIHPVDNGADVRTAKVIQGMIRHIENDSHADIAYDTAFEGAVVPGFGFLRVISVFENSYSFRQKLLIKAIQNGFTTYLDPHHKEPDGSDAKYGFIAEDIPKDQFLKEYPDSKLNGSEWPMADAHNAGWIEADTIRVAEYYTIDYEDQKIFRLSNQKVVTESEYKRFKAEFDAERVRVLSERKTQVPRVKWYKITSQEILDRTDVPGEYIPIIPVYGNITFIDGQRHLEGIIRQSMDSQRMYNYMASTEAETIALSPKAPFIATVGQTEDFPEWGDANSRTYSVLRYKPETVNGALVPPPQRNTYEAPVAAITNARMQSSEDIKSTTGIYDAAMGARSNENSGIAIQRRAHQSQTSNFHFLDNLTRSKRHLGRILVGQIPYIYDEPQAIRIIGEEDEQEIIQLHQEFKHKGEDVLYDPSVGQYDVVVETGPGFATKRQESLEAMLDLSQSYPQLIAIMGDLMLKNMDAPGAAEMAERFKRTIDPKLLGDSNQGQVPPEVQAQMQQAQLMIDQLTQKLNEANDREKTKLVEVESKERIEMAKLKNQLVVEQMKLQGAASNLLFENEVNQISRRQTDLDYNEPFDQDVQDQPAYQNQSLNFNESGQEQAAIQNEQNPGALMPERPMEQ